MRSLKLLLVPFLVPTGFLFGQYCTAVGPSSTIDSNVETVQLTGVIGSINYTGCPGVVGLQDLTASTSVTLNAGGNYSVTIKFGTCGGIYSGAGTAWIDFNGNYTFETAEIIASWQGTPPYTGTYPFTVPAGAQNGLTRMRVIQQEGTVLPLIPCATFSWGSATDFSVTIGNGIDCSGYIGDDTTDPVIVGSLPYTSTGDNSFCYSNQNLVYASPDVYYLVNPSPLMESVHVSLCGSSFDTFLSVIDGAGNVIAFNDDAAGCVTSSELTFNTQGLGQVYVIVEGWGAEMGEYQIAIDANYLGIEESDLNGVSFFPNPTDKELTVKGLSGSIELLDLAGKVVLQAQINELGTIDISSLVEGVYLIKYQVNNMMFSRKIIVE